MLRCESISLNQSETMTSLPSELIEGLVNHERIPGELGENGELCVGKHALLGWCRVYARILNHVIQSTPSFPAGYAPFELVWMSRHGMLRSDVRA